MMRAASLLVVLGTVALLGWHGCTNDPFDPSSLGNKAPTVRFFVVPADSGGDLNATSYNRRTFAWSGSDQDGDVVAYYVSVRTAREIPAPWIETTDTDTTMTFVPDDEGLAEATFYLVCRDNLGALSDTVVQYVPMRNFPPVINFQSDFEPFSNLQREIRAGQDGAPPDTVYWNWGPMSGRFFAYDPDGADAMDDYFRYTIADELPDCVRLLGEFGADPRLCWVQAPFTTSGDVREFSLLIPAAPPGPRTLTISVSDEAGSETHFTYSWEVREPRGRVLLVPDNYGSFANNLYRPFLNDYFGPEGYDVYDFWFGYPDDPAVLLNTLRQFDVVLWLGNDVVSQNLTRAASRSGVLEQYLSTSQGDGGRLWLVSRAMPGGSSGLPGYFMTTMLHIVAPPSPIYRLQPKASAVGLAALGQAAWLPDMILQSRTARGWGLSLAATAEVLYRFANCDNCFGGNTEVDEPIIVCRQPRREVAELARVVDVSFDLEYMDRSSTLTALAAIMEHELGVPRP